jgi:hypothetical protein
MSQENLPPLAGGGRRGAEQESSNGQRTLRSVELECAAPSPALPRERGREDERRYSYLTERMRLTSSEPPAYSTAANRNSAR